MEVTEDRLRVTVLGEIPIRAASRVATAEQNYTCGTPELEMLNAAKRQRAPSLLLTSSFQRTARCKVLISDSHLFGKLHGALPSTYLAVPQALRPPVEHRAERAALGHICRLPGI